MLTQKFLDNIFSRHKDFLVQLSSSEVVMHFDSYNPAVNLKINEYTYYFQITNQKAANSFFQIPKNEVISYGLGSPYDVNSFDDYREIVGYIRFKTGAEFLFLSYDNL